MTKTKLIRISYVSLALLIGIGIVYALTLAGKESKGPVETILDKASDVVTNVEKDIILEERKEKRADKLQWLNNYKADKSKLKNAKQIFFGAYDNNATGNFQPIIDLEDTLHTKFPFIHIYTAWGSKKEHQFPKEKVESIIELGSIPVITWEPWLTAFDSEKYPNLKPLDERDKNGLADVTNGVYDFYIKQWAKAVQLINSPIILRWGHEMNDPYRYPWGPHNNTANDFIAAYKHIYKIFENLHVKNVLWAWSPHPAYGYFTEYYPGDDFVDYVAIGTLNYGTVANWSKWWSFDEIFGKYYKDLGAFNKPIILSEFGSLTVGGSRSKWFADGLKELPTKYPKVNAVLFFHYDNDKTTTQQTLNWYFINDKKVVAAITPQLSNLTVK